MDTLTHIVLGAAVGEILMGKQIGKKAMLWGALAANAPDADAVLGLFASDIDTIVHHRMLTHSIFVALISGPILGWVLWKAHSLKGMLNSWMLLVTSNLIIHDLLDTCTVYGTGLLTPFNDYRFSFDNIFVADPLYTIPLIISGVVLLVLPNKHHLRKAWNSFGLITSSAYLMFTFYNHHQALEALELSIDEKGIQSKDHFAAPTLFNNMLWQVVARDTNGFWIGYYSIFDESTTPELYFVPKNDDILKPLAANKDIKKLKEFSKGFYCITESPGKVLFNVMRFGQVAGWEGPKATFAFAFDLTENADNSLVVQKGRIEGSGRIVVKSMWERIKGVK